MPIPAQAPGSHTTVHSFPLRPTIRPVLVHYRETLLQVGEVLLILIWTLIVGWAYLNPSPQVWPNGPEYPSSVTANYVWMLLPKCGTCVFWNGLVGGGAPAFSDIFASLLHPLVILAVLAWGVVNGTKMILLCSFFIAGFGQWWLTRIMGLGRIARLFCAAIAVAGGHLAARMELGPVGLLFSTACCMLVIAPAVGLGLTGKRRYAILLALAVASALLAGQGYMQVGLALSVLPALLIFLFDGRLHLRPVWKEFLLAAALALLLAGVFLVPMLHFYPNINKYTDPAFPTAQAIGFIPLNQVIADQAFYQSTSLKNVPYPHLYADYIGWVPVLLALLALRIIPKSQQRLLLYLLAAMALVYLAASALTLKALAYLLPVQATGVRFTPILASLANPLLLGLSAWGLDGLVRLISRTAGRPGGSRARWLRKLAANLGGLALIAVLLLAIKSVYDFGHGWLDASPIGSATYTVAQALVTDHTEWVNLPYGEHFWAIPAFENGLKLANGVRSWKWDNHDFPPAFREGTRAAVDAHSPDYITTIGDIHIVNHPENEYAFIESGNQIIPCQAHALGGNIDVTCPPVSGPGQLVVREYYYQGWTAWQDRVRTSLLPSPWLSVAAPDGQHTFSFRYRPWDVWVGMALSLAGLVLCAVLFLHKP